MLLAAPLLMTSGLWAQAPDRREMDLAVTYTAQHSNLVANPTFWQQGGSVEISAQVHRGLGLAANITGTNVGGAAGSGVGLTMVAETFGPRYTWYRANGLANRRSLAIFGQGLIGIAQGFNSYFPSNTGAMTDDTSFALQVGGGVDLGLSRHFALRAIQADWIRTQFPNSTTNVQNNLRLAAGVVFRFQQR
jgi:peptidoglycan-associated lipoprotein